MSQSLMLGGCIAATLAAAVVAAIAQPEAVMLAPGVISTAANEFSGTMSPDGREIWFSRSVPRSYGYAIFVSRKVGGRWTAPELAPFSGHGRDFDPVMAPDGRSMVFISDRPTEVGKPKHDYDVWRVERSGAGWGPPRNLGTPVNTSADNGEGNEWFASLAADGTLYFAADDRGGGGAMRIYRARPDGGGYQEPEALGAEINDGGFNGEPVIAPDQSFLLFARFGGKGGHGNWDIWVSRAVPGGGWSAPENLGPSVNTAVRDYSPRLEPDGHTLTFTSERYPDPDKTMTYADFEQAQSATLNGQGNLYEIDLRCLGLETLKGLLKGTCGG